MLDFEWGGVTASSKGIQLQGAVSFSEPVPDIETIKVPGRNGDLHIMTGSYASRTAVARCFVLADNAANAMAVINDFLFGSGIAKKTLKTSDDPDHYWNAIPVSSGKMETRNGVLNAFEITWSVDPFRIDAEGNECL